MVASCIIQVFRKLKRRGLVALNISNVQACIGGIFVTIILVICFINFELIRNQFEPRSAADINSWRLTHLSKTCKKWNNGGHTNLQPAFYLHSKNHSLVYCLVFKAATSSWFYNFNSWAGYSEHEIMHIDNLFLARKFYPKENRLTLMQSMEHSFSFIVVRHPFERLMSAFEDRLVSKKNAYYTRVAQAIYKRYHPIGRGSISFRDFVQYIIDDVEHNNARYDFIIKLETYKQDVENMIRATNLQGVVKLAQVNHVRKDAVSTLAVKYFSQITQQQMDRLYSIYEIDFELFGYSAETYFQIPKALV